MKRWVAACDVTDIPNDEGHVVELAGRKLALFLIGEQVFAINDECPHEAGTSLAMGWIDDAAFTVECPYHQSLFDLRSGEVLSPPATANVGCYSVRVAGGAVEIELED